MTSWKIAAFCAALCLPACSDAPPDAECKGDKCDDLGSAPSVPGIVFQGEAQGRFRATLWAELPSPTAIALGEDGRYYVSNLDGSIVAFRDGGDQAAEREEIASGLSMVLGLAFEPGTDHLFFSRKGGVEVLKVSTGGRDTVLDGLPDGNHPTNDVEFDPTSSPPMLYVANGSLDDDGSTPGHRTQATILRLAASDRHVRAEDVEVFATGLRNSYGMAFDRQGNLWATDNSGDKPMEQHDELNLVQAGKHYGWPGCFGFKTDCAQENPSFALQMHSSANGLTVYEGQAFPETFRGAIFMAQFGVSVPDARFANNGHRLVFVQPNESGAAIDPADTHSGQEHVFATGFGQPVDVMMAADESLLLLDFERGAIYKIIASETGVGPVPLCEVQQDASGNPSNLFAPEPQVFNCDENQQQICNNAVSHGSCESSRTFQCQCIDGTSWWVQCRDDEVADSCGI